MLQAVAKPQAFQISNHSGALILAHEAIVDVQQPEVFAAQGFLEQQGANRGIDTAGDQQQHVTAVDLLAHGLGSLVHLMTDRPVRGSAADFHHEVAQQGFATQGVVHFRVKLEPVLAQAFVGDGGETVVLGCVGAAAGVPDLDESAAQAGDGVAMAHPYRLFLFEAGEERGVLHTMQRGGTVFPAGMLHRAAVVFGDFLVAEAEA